MSYAELTAVHKLWELTQGPMKAVTRFGNFPDYGQLLVEHQASLPITHSFVRAKLAPLMPGLDWDLIGRCCAVHDCGEPLTGGDEHIDNKTGDKDQREYEAVRQLLVHTGDLYRPAMMAFLLPFVRREKVLKMLSSDDTGLLSLLKTKYQREAAVFALMEPTDYIMSALTGRERGIRNDREFLYDHVIKRQTPPLDALVAEYPVLSAVWSPDLKHMLWSQLIEP